MIKIIKNNLNEILFTYYIFSYSLLRRIIPNYSMISTSVLTINLILVLTISILYNKLKFRFTFFQIILYAGIGIYAVIDSTFRVNQYTTQDYTYLLIFAVVSTYLYTQTKDTKKILQFYCLMSIVLALLYISEPFFGYKYVSSYMEFGYNAMMLPFIGVYILAREKKGILGLILTLFAVFIFGELLVFANKGAIISVILFILLYEIFIKSTNKKKIILIVIGAALILSYDTIISALYDFANEQGIQSYSLTTLYEMENKTINGLSGRDSIWEYAFRIIQNNILLGNGAGYFRTVNKGQYSHNIIFDILIEYGIVIFVILSYLVTKGIIRIKKTKGDERLLGAIFLIMWFPKLFFSSYFQSEMGFWLFIVWGLANKKQIQGEDNENKKFYY